MRSLCLERGGSIACMTKLTNLKYILEFGLSFNSTSIKPTSKWGRSTLINLYSNYISLNVKPLTQYQVALTKIQNLVWNLPQVSSFHTYSSCLREVDKPWD